MPGSVSRFALQTTCLKYLTLQTDIGKVLATAKSKPNQNLGGLPMLRMAGVRVHPALRILIGAVILGIGLMRHHATPALVVGAVLIAWGIAAVLGLARGGDEARSTRDRW
jgi:hypothetical protein